ncbi:MAG: hypothetical protein ACI92E_003320, partial [Oceanicoccus sp.]
VLYTLHHQIAALRSQRRVSGWALTQVIQLTGDQIP